MEQLLSTKLFIPSIRQELVSRPRLIERLNHGLLRVPGVTLISAPAGFGKTTLISEWVAGCRRPTAWLSLDERDNDPSRFLDYLVAALQTIVPGIGEGLSSIPQAPQPPTESILTTLLNEISTRAENFLLILNEYHAIDSRSVDQALTFLLEHLPPQLHLVISTRQDPDLPLARLRVRGQLTELRAADLRFTSAEAAEFLNQVMGLNLLAEHISALEDRTEGWIAGLQLAAISLQGHRDAASFIESFTGNHHFVMDYLLEEVLKQQPASVQTFLLRTSILDSLCGPLCDAVLLDLVGPTSAQKTLEYLERTNLFIVPLDNQRHWYRYHHLFADLLRQRLQESLDSASLGEERETVAELHLRASRWYEARGLELEAFHHATAANDIERAERLIEGDGVPLYFRGTVVPVMQWLESLPKSVLDARPSLWVMSASTQLLTDHTLVEQKLQAAESALQDKELDAHTRDVMGRIASLRATLAVIQHDAEAILAQSRRALEFLHPDNLPLRVAASWSLGHAYQLQGERAAASQAFRQVISISKSLGDSVYTIAATINLGQVQEVDNQLSLATKTYKRVLQMVGDPPQPMACEAYLGLARIYYQWNDLDTAQQHGQQCLQQTRQIAMENVDTVASCQVLLARLKLIQGDMPGAVADLAAAEEFVRQHGFLFRMADVAAGQVLTLLYQGNLAKAAQLAEIYKLPLSLARVLLARGEPSAALELLEPLRQQADDRDWQDERLKVMVLQALAFHAQGEKDKALEWLNDALVLAEPGGFIRLFVDEGEPMRLALLDFRRWMARQPQAQDYKVSSYVDHLLMAFAQPVGMQPSKSSKGRATMVEPLSERELEVLKLLRTELNGPEIARGLMISLNTIRTHTKNIYSKLGVNNRRAAARRAEELDLL
ncbi:MAG TPA: LuxR C-terminal-related transcriptional regulator [Anaerolineales bacterium]|nr:LuxR C-terminal-related transcriptional regulator [Anaerolineales bacterium]